MAPWDWVGEKVGGVGEKIGGVGANINVPSAAENVASWLGDAAGGLGFGGGVDQAVLGGVVKGGHAIRDLMTGFPDIRAALNLKDQIDKGTFTFGDTGIGRAGGSAPPGGTAPESATPPAPSTPGPGPNQFSITSLANYNPAAVQLFWSQNVAPLIQQTNKQFTDANAAFAAMADPSHSPVGQYLPQSFRDFFTQSNAQDAMMNNNVARTTANAMPAAAGIDLLQNQLNEARQTALNAYIQSKVNESSNAATSQNTAISQYIDEAIKKAQQGQG